jgi:hypothetical protein
MMPYITGALFFAVLGGVYALSYVLNSKTPVPDNCKDMLVGCSTCSTSSCGHSTAQSIKEN